MIRSRSGMSVEMSRWLRATRHLTSIIQIFTSPTVLSMTGMATVTVCMHNWTGQSAQTTFGDMWVYVVEQYVNDRYDDQGNIVTSGEWERYATYNAPVRFMPFGDPSLRIGGVPH